MTGEMQMECVKTFANHEERLHNCENYQKRNNGAVLKMSDEFHNFKDGIYNRFMALYILVISNLVALVLLLLR